MPKFVHIDIGADDPERAAAFFRSVFGWSVRKADGPLPYWLIATSDDETSIGAGIGERSAPWQGTIPTIEVDSLAVYQDKIIAQGGSTLGPATHMPGVGDLLTFRDCEGNVFTLLEPEAADHSAVPQPPSEP